MPQSPCVSVCQINARSGFCVGCGRTREEIIAWPNASPAWQGQISAALPLRLRRSRPSLANFLRGLLARPLSRSGGRMQ